MIVYHLQLQKLAICQPQLAYQVYEDGYVPIKNSRQVEAYMESMHIKLSDLDVNVVYDEKKDEYYLESPENPENSEEQYVFIEEFVHPNSVKGLTDLDIKNAVDFINADEKDLLQVTQITTKTLPGLIEKAKKLLVSKNEKTEDKKEDKKA